MSSKAWKFYNPVTRPVRSCDVVWCKFPIEFVDIEPGPKERPGLIRMVKRRVGEEGLWVSVSYGTSKLKTETRPLDLRITNAASMVEAGLPQATRFDLDECVLLPWAEEFFVVRPGYKTPVVGSLSADRRARLAKLLDIRLEMEAREKLGDEED